MSKTAAEAYLEELVGSVEHKAAMDARLLAEELQALLNRHDLGNSCAAVDMQCEDGEQNNELRKVYVGRFIEAIRTRRAHDLTLSRMREIAREHARNTSIPTA